MSNAGVRVVPLPGAQAGDAQQSVETLRFSTAEWLRVAGLYSVVGALHLLGWGLFLFYAPAYPALSGLGVIAYLFGLRHAFDADHISAVDDTIRFLMQKDQRPLAVGFFFSLGHSAVVFALVVAIVLSASTVMLALPQLENLGGLIGAGFAGLFLWVIGLLNLLVLIDIVRAWGDARRGAHGHRHVDELLAQRGFLNRLFGGRLQRRINHSWQLFPVGVLFGLGFDTASEVGLLAMSAGALNGHLPVLAVLSLPLLFAAGMSLMDTTDGVLMVKAYRWAFANPLRKIYYNITITGLSVMIALLVGSVQLAQVAVDVFGLNGAWVDLVTGLDFSDLGVAIVAIFLLAWGGSVAIWRLGRFEQRYGPVSHTHRHAHPDGVEHAHEHFHE